MVDVSAGYVQGPGGYYRQSDRSGPYTIDAAGVATLIGDDVGMTASIAASELHLGQFGGEATVWLAGNSRTRPANATPYAVNGAIGDSGSCLFTFSNFFRKNANNGLLTGMRLTASVASIVPANMGAVRAHLYHTTPASPPSADQVQFALLVANQGNKVGYVDFSTWVGGGTGSDMIESYGAPVLNNMPVRGAAAARDLFCLIVATAIFTPIASAIITPFISCVQD